MGSAPGDKTPTRCARHVAAAEHSISHATRNQAASPGRTPSVRATLHSRHGPSQILTRFQMKLLLAREHNLLSPRVFLFEWLIHAFFRSLCWLLNAC
jgi:hypothetical protein